MIEYPMAVQTPLPDAKDLSLRARPVAAEKLPHGVHAEPGLPLVLRCAHDGPKDVTAVQEWYGAERHKIEALTVDHGAVLLRGFALPSVEAFGRLSAHHTEHRLRYVGGATPRARVSGHVYESTRIDARFKIELHQEKSYMPSFPRLLAFYCEYPPEEGGETLVCDMCEVTDRLPEDLKSRFARLGVLYKRNFRDGERRDMAIESGVLRDYHRVWQEAFDCQERADVERQCAQIGLQFEWLNDGSVTVSNVRPALVHHAGSGREIWFNQVTAQHPNPRSMGSRYHLLERFYARRPAYPYEVRYGDGGPISLNDLLPIYSAFGQCEIAVSWQQGDYLLIDNIQVAHGRNPYSGSRVIRVALMD
jgi:alpha-ketoglutarate-dependent taurine dioxygenase